MRPTGLSVRRAQSGYDAPPLVRRVLRPVVELRAGESTTALAMFAYSFLAMTAYNIIKPVTRSKFISDLGADNLPWVQLGAGLLIGVIMHGHDHARGAGAAPVGDSGDAGRTVWRCCSGSGRCLPPDMTAASAAFYVLGLILGILLISQFWTLANDVYDARHAKRLFGFIGGGASLGGATGAAITAGVVDRVGTVNLLLVGAAVMTALPRAGALHHQQGGEDRSPRQTWRRRASAARRRSDYFGSLGICSSSPS